MSHRARVLVRVPMICLVLAASLGAAPASAPPPWSAPPLERSIAVWDMNAGRPATLAQMLDALAEAEVVFLGETHADETTHRVELAVYEGLLARREQGVVLALEMFERDVQPVVDAYLAGEIDEARFLDEARPWDNYGEAYRPLIETAREGGHPVLASNMPRALIRRVAVEGFGVVDDLAPDERAHAPAELHPNTPLYWKRVENTTRGHMVMMMRRMQSDAQRLISTQSLWDNAMGETCARALAEHPDKLVLHVNGLFHSAYREGTVHQLLMRRPDAKVKTVTLLPATVPASASAEMLPPADFVVFTEARAASAVDRHHAVALDRELRYRMHVPDEASFDARVPLFVWLGDDGLTADDGLALWRDALGSEVAIASIEPPYRARFADLSEGGRWFWADTFASDVAAAGNAVERIWAYLARRHPIDRGRVLVAGEGTGGTVVAALPLTVDRLTAKALALTPTRYAKIRDIPLPLRENRLPGDTIDVALTVMPRGDDDAWWREELEGYRDVGIDAEVSPIAPEDDARVRFAESQVRDALRLAPLLALEGNPKSVRVPADTPRARHWARLYAGRHARSAGEPVSLVMPGRETALPGLPTATPPARISDELPRCPGPFGGTTVVVLTDDVSEPSAAAWYELEENDPLAASSRFHRLRVATIDGERALPSVLATLLSERRKNVLIVPATFYAGPETMRRLEDLASELEDRMTLHWLPGLGGRIPAL